MPVTARFSNGGGNPAESDAQRLDGRGLAVKFHLPDGGATDIVLLTLPVFFVRGAEDFLAFLRRACPTPAPRARTWSASAPSSASTPRPAPPCS